MKKIFLSFTFVTILSLISCKEEVKKEETTLQETETIETPTKEVTPFTKDIETAHKKNDFLSKEAVSYTIVVKFGGQDYLDAKFTQSVDGTMIKMEKADGETIIYDGTEVYTNKADGDLGRARFDIFTWSYFFALPYKLNDNGTLWSDFTNKPFYGEEVPTGKLSFESNIGDAPDDWYVAYKNPNNNYLVGAAYIVSYGKGKEKAEEEPHAVKYNNFTEVEGIPFSTDWTYHMWTNETGFGDLIGEAKLSNITFSKLNTEVFKKPSGATIVPLNK